jgi:hypothetical protein
MSWLRRGRWIKSLKKVKFLWKRGIWINEMMDDSRAIPIITNDRSKYPKSWVKLPYIIYSITRKFKKLLIVYRKIANKLHLDGLLGSAVSFVIRALFKIRRSVLIILNNRGSGLLLEWPRTNDWW